MNWLQNGFNLKIGNKLGLNQFYLNFSKEWIKFEQRIGELALKSKCYMSGKALS